MEHRNSRNNRTKTAGGHGLFHHSHSSPLKNQFIELFQKFKQESKNRPSSAVFKGQLVQTGSTPSSQKDLAHREGIIAGQTHMDSNTSIEQLLVTAVVQNRRQGQRAVSSHKFDDLLRKNCSRRLKKGKITLFQYAKELERKESDSKKSTDYSNSEEIEQLRTENELYREFLELQSEKLKRLEKAITEEKKKHELEKFLIGRNIEKLKKVAELQTDAEKMAEIIENQEMDDVESYLHLEAFDTLSIQSH